LGRTNPDAVEVTEGLRVGDRVCVSAEPEFADGMRIVVGKPTKTGLSKTHALMKNLKKNKKTDKNKPSPKGLFGTVPRSR
jgi:hypothetical protein